MINAGKTFEQLIGIEIKQGYRIKKWISFFLEENKFTVGYYKVLDERKKGIESIYDCSYVEPYNIYEKTVFGNFDFDSVVEWLKSSYSIQIENFIVFDNLNNELITYNKAYTPLRVRWFIV